MASLRTPLIAILLLGATTGVGLAAKTPLIVSASDLASHYKPAPDVQPAVPGYPAAAVDKSEDVCISLGFQVNPDGKTSEMSVLKVWSSKSPKKQPKDEVINPFLRNAAAAVSLWRFVPAKPGAEAETVYTSTAIPFAGNAGSSADQVRSNCEIDDLKAFVTRAQQQAYRRGDMNKARTEEAQRVNTHVNEDVNNVLRRTNGG